MATVPIPQGASIDPAPQSSSQTVAIPQGATIDSGDQTKDVTDANGNIVSGPDAGGISEGQQVKQAAIGAGKRLLSGIADIGDVATLGLTHLLPGSGQASGGINAPGTALQPTNENQKYGGYVGDLATFELGSGIMDSLQHLPLAERLVQAAKALDIAKAHPVLANLAHKAVESGLTAGAGTLTATGSPKAAAVVAGIGAAAPIAGTAVSKVAGKAADALDFLNPKAAQEPLQAGINDVAGETGNARNSFQQAGDKVLAQSKAGYKVLDEASGGRWQRFDDQLKLVRNGLSKLIEGVDDDKIATLEQRRNEIETSQANLIDELTNDGKIDANTAKDAVANYKKAQSLYDVDAAVKGSSSGGITDKKGLEVDPKKLQPKLERMFDSGRLQQAVGEDDAKALLNHTYTAADTAEKAARYRRLASRVAISAGAGIAGGVGAHAAGEFIP